MKEITLDRMISVLDIVSLVMFAAWMLNILPLWLGIVVVPGCVFGGIIVIVNFPKEE